MAVGGQEPGAVPVTGSECDQLAKDVRASNDAAAKWLSIIGMASQHA